VSAVSFFRPYLPSILGRSLLENLNTHFKVLLHEEAELRVNKFV